jgi:hypothetical protein
VNGGERVRLRWRKGTWMARAAVLLAPIRVKERAEAEETIAL